MARPETQRKLPSLLTPGLRRLLWFFLAPALALLANTVYLVLVRVADVVGVPQVALNDNSLPVVFQAMVLSHTGLGILVVSLGLAFLIWHLPAVWKRRHRASVVSGISLGLAAVLLLVTGLYILTEAASRDNRGVWWLHVLVAVAGPAAFLVHRFTSYVESRRQSYVRSGSVVGGIVAVLIVFHVASPDFERPVPGHNVSVAAGDGGFVPLGFVDPSHTFFPSPATTGSGGLANLAAVVGVDSVVTGLIDEVEIQGFFSSGSIGVAECVRCHADVVNQDRKSVV